MDKKDINKPSYTYWVNNDKKFFEGIEQPNCKPQQLKNEEDNNKYNPNNGSKWNFAGVWEEKILCNKEVINFLNNFKTKFFSKILDFNIVDINDLDGEVSAVYSRGKVRLGYNINFKIDLEQDKEKIGKVHINEITDDGDFELNFIDIENEEIKKKIYEDKDNIEKNIRNLFKYMKEIKTNNEI